MFHIYTNLKREISLFLTCLLLGFAGFACSQAAPEPETITAAPPAENLAQEPSPTDLSGLYVTNDWLLVRKDDHADRGKMHARLNLTNAGTFRLVTRNDDMELHDSGTYTVQGTTIQFVFDQGSKFYNDFTATFDVVEKHGGILKMKSADLLVNDDFKEDEQVAVILKAAFKKQL